MIRLDISGIYRSVILEQKTGIKPAALRCLLTCFSWIYAFCIRFRQTLYRLGLIPSFRAPCCVISVGNLTCGGTGKTPMTAWLARWLGKKNLKVAIISRGYGKIPYRNTDDEDVLLDVEMENVVRLRGVNKILLAKRALREYGADILILDDGFQHIRIKRDLDIVLIDATDPFSNYKLIPRGLLREKPTSLSRADILILTRTDQVKPQDLNLLEDRIKKMGYKGPILQSIHRPVYAWSFYDRRIVDLGSLRRRQWYAFCGLGNPKAFIQTLSSYNIPLVRYHLFPDHHVYTQLELQRLVAEAQEFMADAMLTTEKDAKRIPHPWALPMELFVLKVELEITQGEQILFGVLNDLVKDLQHIAITAT